MNPERLSILDRVASGELSAAEASTMLSTPKPTAPGNLAALANRWLRVRVTDLDTGQPRVNLNVPLSLVKAGLKIGASHEPSLANIDWQEVLGELSETTQGKIVEVEDQDERERVEIYVD